MQESKAGGKVRLVVFDLDGTLTRPYLDFAEIRKALGNDDPKLLTLDFIVSLPAGARERAWEVMHGYEEEAAANAELQEGALEVLLELSRRGIATAIFTRNSRNSVETVLAKFGVGVDRIITREDAPPKPDPTAISELMKQLEITPEQALMVGDFALDIEAGKRAGIATVLVRNGDSRSKGLEADYEIDNLLELLEIIDGWR
jgi:HAD superfamily hydrolase (TIGR01509 family)